MEQFNCRGVLLDYVTQGYNEPWKHNRCWEIPLALWFVKKYEPNLIEVGAVTPYYPEIYPVHHKIYDPTDPLATDKTLAQDLDYTGQNVLCISTIEHMGKDEYDVHDIDPELPVKVFLKMLKANIYLISWPRHYTVPFSTFVFENFKNNVVLFRQYTGNIWKETEVPPPDEWGYVGLVGIITNDNELLGN